MQELLLVNPRRRKAAKRRKNPSAAQKRARARFAAMARARAHNPRKRRSRRANPVTVVHTARRRNPVRRHRRSARRSHNPISFRAAFSHPMAVLKPAAIGAVGAAAVNTLLSKLPLPPMLMAGRVRYLTQGLAAIALGMVAQKVGVKGQTAADMARGSLTVTLYDALRDVAGSAGINLQGMGVYMPGRGVQAMPSAGGNAAMTVNGMGKYVSGPGSNVTQLSGIGRMRSGFKSMNF